MKELTIPVTAPMPPELDLQARICAAKMKVSRAELVRLALIDYLKRLEVQPTPTIPTKQESSYELIR